MRAAVSELAAELGVAEACAVLSVPRSQWYRVPAVTTTARDAAPPTTAGDAQACTPAEADGVPASQAGALRALSAAERAHVLEILTSPRFVDQTPREIYATLLDEGVYLCHWRHMYRILQENQLVRERRNQLRHPVYRVPQLLATQPNAVWSWDITKLLGPYPLTYFYLYVVLDIFSRYLVGWHLAERESAELAHALIADSCAKQAIQPGQLTLHADRGAAMVSLTLGQLLNELGVTKSHSRPHVSDDNPFSEAQFKTMKYRPDYPKHFADLEQALTWVRAFVPWYNDHHRHSALALLTPADVHYGRAQTVIAQRQRVLAKAYTDHPERFSKGDPLHPPVPPAVWINPPKPERKPDPDPTLLH